MARDREHQRRHREARDVHLRADFIAEQQGSADDAHKTERGDGRRNYETFIERRAAARSK